MKKYTKALILFVVLVALNHLESAAVPAAEKQALKGPDGSESGEWVYESFSVTVDSNNEEGENGFKIDKLGGEDVLISKYENNKAAEQEKRLAARMAELKAIEAEIQSKKAEIEASKAAMEAVNKAAHIEKVESVKPAEVEKVLVKVNNEEDDQIEILKVPEKEASIIFQAAPTSQFLVKKGLSALRLPVPSSSSDDSGTETSGTETDSDAESDDEDNLKAIKVEAVKTEAAQPKQQNYQYQYQHQQQQQQHQQPQIKNLNLSRMSTRVPAACPIVLNAGMEHGSNLPTGTPAARKSILKQPNQAGNSSPMAARKSVTLVEEVKKPLKALLDERKSNGHNFNDGDADDDDDDDDYFSSKKERQTQGSAHPQGQVQVQVNAHPQGQVQANARPQGQIQGMAHPQGQTRGSAHPQGQIQGYARPQSQAQGYARPQSQGHAHPQGHEKFYEAQMVARMSTNNRINPRQSHSQGNPSQPAYEVEQDQGREKCNDLSGIHLGFCEVAALGAIVNIKMMSLKYPRQANSVERKKMALYITSLINNFPCDKEKEVMKRVAIMYPPIYTERRSFNKWAIQYTKTVLKEIRSPVGLSMNNLIVPLKKKK